MSGGVVSGPSVRNDAPEADDYGLVVRGVGLFPVIAAVLQQRYDVFASSATLIYVGYAALGVVDADAAWRIKRITFVSGNPTAMEWSGSGFTVAWTARGAIPYS